MKTLSNYITEFVKTGAIKEEYVDLGLPSGTRWASCNIGAKEPYEYGEYFQWGGLEDRSKSECTKDNMPFGDNPPKQLPSENDVVYQQSHGKACMPTQEDIQELIDNTEHKWCKYSDIDPKSKDDTEGCVFIGKNDNSIFIPAGGNRSWSLFYCQGSNCNLWSSSLNESSPGNAWYLYVSSSNTYVGNGYHRFYGRRVRGVRFYARNVRGVKK